MQVAGDPPKKLLLPPMNQSTRLSVYGAAARNGRILVIRLAPHVPSGGQWSLPGGGVDWGETLHEALHREVWEEAGLTCNIGEMAFEYGFKAGRDENGLFIHQVVFFIEASPGHPKVIEQEGSTEHVEWVDFEEAEALPLVPVARLALNALRSRESSDE
jgi:8-oxo-dGTP diphosphatase